MNVLDRITILQNERNWTAYRLSQESGIPQTTISSWYKNNMTPSISSLERICDAYHITLSQFFSEGEPVEITNEQRKLLQVYARLSKYQQSLVLEFLDSL